VKQLVRSGKISAGHARLLVGHPNAERIAQEIIEKNLSVRQVEAQLQQEAATQRRESQRESKGNSTATKDADTRALEKRLSDALGLAVSVDHRGEGGTLRIKYRDLEQLDAVLKKLGA
jgi:ParB family chromosome partitioning protein